MQRVAEYAEDFISNHISTFGIFRHIGLFLTSSTEDIVLKNPNFNAELAGEHATKIYCSHGTFDRNNSFSLVAERLLPVLPVNVEEIRLVAFDGRLQGTGVTPYAEQLINKVDSKNAIFMGHSRGCLVSAKVEVDFAKKHGVNMQLGVYVGGPFDGSDVADWFAYGSDSVKDMQRGSEFLKDVVPKLVESKVPHLCFAAENDFFVDAESACIPGCENFEVLDRHGHLSILSSHRLVEKIRVGINKLFPEELSVKPSDEYFENLNRELHFSGELFEKINREDDLFGVSLTLKDVCLELKMYIEQFKQKNHLWSSEAKVAVLEKLQEMLGNMCESGQRGECYPKARTIGDFIKAYLEDASINNGIKPIDALNSQLNWPLNYVSDTYTFLSGAEKKKVDSKDCVSMLAEKYSHAFLPHNQMALNYNSCTI